MLDLDQHVVKSAKEQGKLYKRQKKQLLQNKVRCINAMIEDNYSYINKYGSRLASIVTKATDRDTCSKFIEEVRQDRFIKIKNRWVNKFNRLVNKSSSSSIRNLSKSSSYRSNVQVQAPDNNINSNNHVQAEINNKWIVNYLKQH